MFAALIAFHLYDSGCIVPTQLGASVCSTSRLLLSSWLDCTSLNGTSADKWFVQCVSQCHHFSSDGRLVSKCPQILSLSAMSQASQASSTTTLAMQAQGHLHAMSQPMQPGYPTQSSLQSALHHHQNSQTVHGDTVYGQPDAPHMMQAGQHTAHEHYHPQVSGMYVQQTGQPLMSEMGEAKQDLMALPFPQPSLNAYGQPMEPQHPGHMETASSHGQHHGSGSGSEFPTNSPEGALSPGDNSRKYVSARSVSLQWRQMLHTQHLLSTQCMLLLADIPQQYQLVVITSNSTILLTSMALPVQAVILFCLLPMKAQHFSLLRMTAVLKHKDIQQPYTKTWSTSCRVAIPCK